jgi:hypothetical protein
MLEELPDFRGFWVHDASRSTVLDPSSRLRTVIDEGAGEIDAYVISAHGKLG